MCSKWLPGYASRRFTSDEFEDAGWSWGENDDPLSRGGILVREADMVILDEYGYVSAEGRYLYSGAQIAGLMAYDEYWKPYDGDHPEQLIERIVTGKVKYEQATLVTAGCGVDWHGLKVRGLIALPGQACVDLHRPLPTSSDDWLWKLPEGWTEFYSPLTSMFNQPLPCLYKLGALL